MWNYGASTKHRTAKTTERKSPQNATEGIVSEEESSAGVLATALKEFQEIIVKQELISQMSDLRNFIQGSLIPCLSHLCKAGSLQPSKESVMWKIQFRVMSGPSVSSKKDNEVLKNKMEYIEITSA